MRRLARAFATAVARVSGAGRRHPAPPRPRHSPDRLALLALWNGGPAISAARSLAG